MQRTLSTRDYIVEKSAELFNTHGYAGCSLSDIMKATNLQKGGIYNHFKNKDEIALAAFDYSFSKVIRQYRKRLDQDKNSLEKLNSILSIFESHVLNPIVPGGCPLINTAVYATGSHPALVQRAKEGFNMLRTYIRIKIDEGISGGEFRADTDSEEIATVIMSTLDGAIVMSRLESNTQALETTINFVRTRIIGQMLVS